MIRSCAVCVVLALVGGWRTGGVEGPKSASVCLSTAFVTLEQGRMAAVEWVDNSADRVHTRVVEMESHVVDANIDLRPDATASHAAVTVSVAGDKDVMPMARGLGAGDLLVAAHSELDRAGGAARARTWAGVGDHSRGIAVRKFPCGHRGRAHQSDRLDPGSRLDRLTTLLPAGRARRLGWASAILHIFR
jgi:hypothetical protein